MNNIALSLLEANLLLAVVFGVYYVFLKKLTFFKEIRIYFWIASLLAIFTPFLKRVDNSPLPTPSMVISPIELPVQTSSENISWDLYLGYGLAAVALLLSIRLFMQLFSLYQIHRRSQNQVFEEITYKCPPTPLAPFSFWDWIYVHRPSHSNEEMKQILLHEQIHTYQKHSADVLFIEIIKIAFWYNPACYALAKVMKENLEFLVDAEVLQTGISKKSYQHSLVGISISASSPIGNQFAFKTLKKRIIMMNQTPSQKRKLINFAYSAPVVITAAVLLTFSIQQKAVSQKESPLFSFEIPSDTIKPLKKSAEPLQEIVVTGYKKIVVTGYKKQTPIEEVVVTGYKVEEHAKANNPETVQGTQELINKPPLQDKKVNRVIIDGQEKIIFKGSKTDSIPTIWTIKGSKTDSIPTIWTIKGTKSKKSATSPLVIMDGRIIVSLDHIDPKNIESIRVFKGASVIEQYGQKAKNGLIVITSKEKKKSEPTLSRPSSKQVCVKISI